MKIFSPFFQFFESLQNARALERPIKQWWLHFIGVKCINLFETDIPDLVEDYPLPDPVRVGETCVLRQIPDDLEQRRIDRDAQRTKADKMQSETKESEMGK